MANKQLFVASEIGLLEHLAPGPTTLEELTARTGVPWRTARMIADAMVALGLLDCDAARYENSAAARAYVSEDLRPLLALWIASAIPPCGSLPPMSGRARPRGEGSRKKSAKSTLPVWRPSWPARLGLWPTV
jgi:hypothetical protein